MYANFYTTQQPNQENQEPINKKQKIDPIQELSSNHKGALINETIYFLNKSKTKWISVGFSLDWKYEPVIKMGGAKHNQCIIFDEHQWESFLSNQGVMLSFIHATTYGWQSIQTEGYEIHFVFMGDGRVIKITQDGGNEIFLAGDTINEAANLSNLVKYRFDLLKSQEFPKYYNTIVRSISLKNGDPIRNIYDVILPLRNTNSVNICCLMELLQFYPNDVRVDLEIFSCNEFLKNCIDNKNV